MKKLIIIFLVLGAVSADAQKLKSVEIDKFTNQKRVLAEEVGLFNRMKYPSIKIWLRSVDTTCFFYIYSDGYAVGVVGPTDKLWILLDDNEKIVLSPTTIQTYDFSSSGQSYRHQYRITLADIDLLSKHKIASIRRYYNHNYEDINVSKTNPSKKEERHTEDVMEMAKTFYDEVTRK